jgi:hypothetical protein
MLLWSKDILWLILSLIAISESSKGSSFDEHLKTM